MNNLADGWNRECKHPECHLDRLRGRKFCEKHEEEAENIDQIEFPPDYGGEVFIYFLGVEGEDVVKIGRTAKDDVTSRAQAIQCAHHREILILAHIRLPLTAERWIHKALEKHRIRGEWFRKNDAIDKVISAAKTQNPSIFYSVFADL